MASHADDPSLNDPEANTERASLELIIARARAVVALAVWAASWLDPLEHTGGSPLIAATFTAYALYAAAVAVVLQYRSQAAVRAGSVLHSVDLWWAVIITSLTGGPSSHFSPPLFVFASLAAAYRWGYRETIITGVAGAALLGAEGIAAASGLLSVPLSVGDLVWRTVWLLLVAFILGYLAERDKRLRAESALLARIARNVRVQDGLGASIRSVLEELKREFGAGQVVLASEESTSNRVFAWTTRGAATSGAGGNRPVEIAGEHRDAYFFEVPAGVEVWAARRRARAGLDGVIIRAAGPDGSRVPCSFRIPDRIAGDVPWRSLMALSTSAVEGWVLRVLFIDPDADASDGRRLRFLQTVLRQAGPAVVNVYLVRRLRSKVEEVERARLARELHDGVVQALIGLEMQVDVARRETELAPAKVAATLAHVQQLLREQVVDVRQLMAHLRPVRVDSRTLARELSGIVETFARISGIDARFICPADCASLTPRVCREVVRIVEEALVNARKHSGATSVTVTLTPSNGACRLVIDDNGRGFDFTGQLSAAELDARRAGPAVIKERVHATGGRLLIQSTPGKGATLEVVIPASN